MSPGGCKPPVASLALRAAVGARNAALNGAGLWYRSVWAPCCMPLPAAGSAGNLGPPHLVAVVGSRKAPMRWAFLLRWKGSSATALKRTTVGVCLQLYWVSAVWHEGQERKNNKLKLIEVFAYEMVDSMRWTSSTKHAYGLGTQRVYICGQTREVQ